MGQPIIAVTFVKLADTWYQLSKEARDSLLAKVMVHRDQVSSVRGIAALASLNVAWNWIIIV